MRLEKRHFHSCGLICCMFHHYQVLNTRHKFRVMIGFLQNVIRSGMKSLVFVMADNGGCNDQNRKINHAESFANFHTDFETSHIRHHQVTASGLAPGQYAFVETKAPAGYVLNTEKIEFEISDSSEGKPEATDAGIAIKAFQSSGERRKHVKYTYFYFTIKAADNN